MQDKIPKQRSIWDGLTKTETRHILRKNRNGERARVRAQKKTLGENEAIVIKMRKELRPSTEIAAHLGIDYRTVDQWCKAYFGEKDPLHLHVLSSHETGESCNAIAKRLRISQGIPGRILKRHGIDPWKNYIEKVSEDFRNTGVCKIEKQKRSKKRRKAIAEDLYCFWVELGKVKDIAQETGWGPNKCSEYLNSLDQYHSGSLDRREQSEYNKYSKRKSVLSKQFCNEKAFSDYCCDLIKESFKYEVGFTDLSHMEVDILVYSNPNVLIELKTTSRKVIEAQALGQALLNKASYTRRTESPCEAVVCFPDDVVLSDSFIELSASFGVVVCQVSQLLGVIGGE